MKNLVEKAKLGDVEAFTKIVGQYQGMAVGYAYSILRDFRLAEDVSQEAFLEVFQTLARLEKPEAFPGWLRRVVFKHCDRIIRRKKLILAGMDEAREAPDMKESPAEMASENELESRVMESIQTLPEDQRTVTTLYYIDGYSQKEISEFLETPTTTVKSRLHAARKTLRRRLMSMVKEVIRQHAPGESFTERMRRTVETYLSRGPAEDLMQSEWERKQKELAGEIAEAGEEGFEITKALAVSENAKLREKAVLHCGLRGDERSKELLKTFFDDRSIRVRSFALTWFAVIIHPDNVDYWTIASPAAKVPEEVVEIVPHIENEKVKVRMTVIRTLTAYAALGNEEVERVLRQALADPVHKVRHAAAKALGMECPGCSASA